MDRFLEKANGPYELIMHFHTEEGLSTSFSTPCLLTENLKAELPGVEQAVAMRAWDNVTLNYDRHSTKASGYFVGNAFFELFNYRLLHGQANAVLEDRQSVILSERLAEKLFETTGKAIGQLIYFQRDTPFKVTVILSLLLPMLRCNLILCCPSSSSRRITSGR